MGTDGRTDGRTRRKGRSVGRMDGWTDDARVSLSYFGYVLRVIRGLYIGYVDVLWVCS